MVKICGRCNSINQDNNEVCDFCGNPMKIKGGN